MALSHLTNEELLQQLIAAGVSAGPITATTRPLYEKRLMKKREAQSPSHSAAKKPRVEAKQKPAAAQRKSAVPSPRAAPRQIPPTQRKSGDARERRRRERIAVSTMLSTKSKAQCHQEDNMDSSIPTSEGTLKPVARVTALVADRQDHAADILAGSDEESQSESESAMSVGEALGSQQPGGSGFSFRVPSSPSKQAVGSSLSTLTSIVPGFLQKGIDKVKELFGHQPEQPLVSGRNSLSALGQELHADVQQHLNRSPMHEEISPPRQGRPGPSAQGQSNSQSYDWELDPGDVQICRKENGSLWSIGKGGFGVVYKAIMGGVDEVAVKVVHINSPFFVDQLKQEIDMISKLRHRHIVQFYGACIDPSAVYMVTELMQMDLFSALRRLTNQYKWSGVYGQEVALGVASGINYLHSRKPLVVHRDIKSPNILLQDGLAKLADVGLARTKAESDMTAQKGFTVAWAAPEVVYRKRATEKIDIWSFGIILWEIITGQLPRVGHLNLPLSTPSPLRAVYAACTLDDPVKRPSAQELVQHLKACTHQLQ